MIIHWPQVMVATLVCYVLMIVSLPFNQNYASMYLFAIVSYWSRLPGVGIPSPFFVLYFLDLVDLFSLIISINIGPYQGALFSLFGNMGARMAGVFPYWRGVIIDSVAQFILCLSVPFFYNITGGNIETTMIIFTIIRRLFFIVAYIFSPWCSLPQFIITWIGASAASLSVNLFYAKYFGDYLNGLMAAGVKFNWPIFFGVTLVILVLKLTLFTKDGSKYMDQKYLMKISLQGINYLLEKNKRSKEEKSRVEEEMEKREKGIDKTDDELLGEVCGILKY